MIDDPDLRRARPPRRHAIDFDRLDELDELDELDGAAALDVAARSSAAPKGSWLVALLRPWIDPRPGELRGLIVVLTAGLVLTSALWFDASRRPGELAPTARDGVAFTPVIPVGGDEGWATDAPADDAWGVPTTGATTLLVIHVSGAVADAGLVTLPAGSRVGDAVLAAGGADADAQLERLNLARPLVDGEQIHVPRPGEDLPARAGTASRGVLPDGRIDINLASAEELVTLPGIGPARAQAIIATRDEQPFRVPGDLRRVPGIGEATFQRLAPLVAVG
jgi:competence protein ComEA